MKKMYWLLVLCVIVLIPVFSVNARSNEEYCCQTVIYGTGKQTEISPWAHTVCGNLTYHKMISSGIGHVYYEDGSRYIYFGSAWQCENCNLVMVTKGDIIFDEMTTIGKWATRSYDHKINTSGVTIVGAANYGTCNSNTMDGYKFYYVPY